VKEKFPFFSANPGLVYLDSAATALKPQSVIDALVRYNAHESVNIHRGVYRLSQKATDSVEAVRNQTVAFLSNEKNQTAVFTRGTTEAFNLLAHSLTSPDSQLSEFYTSYADKKTPAVVLSQSEHHANIVPWQIAAARNGYKLFYIPVDATGNYSAPADFLDTIASAHSIRVISLSMQSNVTGIIHDLVPYREWAKRHGAIFIVDAAQAVVHAAQKMKDLAADFVAFSGHKVFGPTGVGALVGPKAVLDRMAVYQGGGGMISLVEQDKSTYLDAPAKFELIYQQPLR
jgi:selenocysteine lyase/cysteine desulfurase